MSAIEVLKDSLLWYEKNKDCLADYEVKQRGALKEALLALEQKEKGVVLAKEMLDRLIKKYNAHHNHPDGSGVNSECFYDFKNALDEETQRLKEVLGELNE